MFLVLPLAAIFFRKRNCQLTFAQSYFIARFFSYPADHKGNDHYVNDEFPFTLADDSGG